MTPIISLLVGIAVVLIITAATAYFVAQEFAYIAVDRSRLGSRAQAGDPRAEATLGITRRTSFMLSGAQLGITVTGLLVGYVAEPLIGQALGDLLSGGARTALAVAIGGVVALGFSTVVQMLLGELFPKNYAIARAEQVADALTPSTRIYLTLFGPLIWVFDKASELLLKALRIEPVHDVESAVTAADLERVVAASRESGTMPQELATVLERIIDFPRRDAAHAMVPRVRVGTVGTDTTIGEVRALMATGHTRYPVLDERGGVVGVVELVDVLDAQDVQAPVSTIARQPLLITEFLPLPDAQEQMQATDHELAVVLDEFGDFAGIVTREDLVEEIVGDLVDEHDAHAIDPDRPQATDASHRSWTISGAAHIDEVERTIARRLPQGEYETIAGLVIQLAGDLPAVGDVVQLRLEPTAGELAVHDDAPASVVTIEVLTVERRVPGTVHITVAQEGAGQ